MNSLMHFTYPKFVDEGCKTDGYHERARLASHGVMSEAGELGDEWKKVFWHGKELNREAVILEMGDVLWYFTLMCVNEGISFEEIMEANMAKILARRAKEHADGPFPK
ncbi:MAG: nucleoside triphosphate pyrophosphohydrolase family protein [Nitrospiraceae bacterium]